MTPKTKRSLIALQIFSIVLTLILFGSGFFAHLTAEKQKRMLASPPVHEINRKLATHVGEPYDRGFHDKIAGLLRSGDRYAKDLNEHVREYGGMAYQLGGLMNLVGIASLFLIARSPSKKTE